MHLPIPPAVSNQRDDLDDGAAQLAGHKGGSAAAGNTPPKAVDIPKPGPMWSVPTKDLTGKMRLIINDDIN